MCMGGMVCRAANSGQRCPRAGSSHHPRRLRMLCLLRWRLSTVCTTPPPHAAPPCWLPVSPQAHEMRAGVVTSAGIDCLDGSPDWEKATVTEL